MTDRYTVSDNLFGYEPTKAGLPWCRYAVVDNKPTKQSVMSPRERAEVLVTLTGPLAFRHVAFCEHRSDAETIAETMNECHRDPTPRDRWANVADPL